MYSTGGIKYTYLTYSFINIPDSGMQAGAIVENILVIYSSVMVMNDLG